MELFDELATVDTANVEPLAHPLGFTALLREDEIAEEEQRDLFQQDAPETHAGYYLVPKVLKG